MSVLEHVVAISKGVRADYGALTEPVAAPELATARVTSVAGRAIRNLLQFWRLDEEHFGSPEWNPLGALIAPGARVVIKPNWVNHYNQSGKGLDCLLTHTSVLETVLEYVALTRPASVIVGDAPIQSCDFNRLRALCGLDAMVARIRSLGLDVSIRDFRRTLLPENRVGVPRVENVHPEADYTVVDVAHESLLEPLAPDASKFRVTMYDPDRLMAAHSAGRHCYLLAREVLDADVVINLPKLKTHKKAGITGALKNLVGINGNKEFLPHHRKGGAANGGDCYQGGSRLKMAAEELLDSANRDRGGLLPTLKGRLAEMAVRGAALMGEDDNIDGSWHGNDTVWRMCLDLQRVLRYCRTDGTLALTPQRRVITITDAIVAGENNGPLAPTPVAAGLVTGAMNPAAAEWVHARLMGFEPSRIPLVSHAFDQFSYPIVDFLPSSIVIRAQVGELQPKELEPVITPSFSPPMGWKGHLELASK